MTLKEDTIRELLYSVGYRSPAPHCYTCEHHSEDEDSMVDRSWTSYCNQFGNIGLVTINAEAICKNYKEKSG